MDYVDDYDESKPRIVFQSRLKPTSNPINSPENPQLNKPLLIISITFSLIFLGLSIFFLNSQFLNPIFIWLFLSFLIGPFAPNSITAGEISVGKGKIVEFIDIDGISDDESKKKLVNKRNRGKRFDLSDVNSNGSINSGKNNVEFNDIDVNSKVIDGENTKKADETGLFSEKEWSEEELGLLRKQLVKYPIGKNKRWEVISEAFKGNHSVESVISKAKSLGKEKPDDSEAFSRFLKDRKGVDKKVGGNEEEVVVWSSGEDIALLNALKTFPKEVALRWEKISAAVPGKSKAVCMKRVTELKKDFRSNKANGN